MTWRKVSRPKRLQRRAANTMPLPVFSTTWYNVLLLAYHVLTTVPNFIGQSKAEEGPVVWSKFAIGKSFTHPCTARTGMLCKYIPSLVLLALRTFYGYAPELTTWLVALHFMKRVLEVLFLHSFSGSPTEDLRSSAIIGLFYAIQSWAYVKDGANASGALLTFGLACFCAGVLGNLWHHAILASLRRPGYDAKLVSSGKYKVPEGGLFGLATCPHYLCECTGFWGIALVSGGLIPLSQATHLTAFMAGQSVATTRWYVQKFGDKWPKERKHMVPFVF